MNTNEHNADTSRSLLVASGALPGELYTYTVEAHPESSEGILMVYMLPSGMLSCFDVFYGEDVTPETKTLDEFTAGELRSMKVLRSATTRWFKLSSDDNPAFYKQEDVVKVTYRGGQVESWWRREGAKHDYFRQLEEYDRIVAEAEAERDAAQSKLNEAYLLREFFLTKENDKSFSAL